MGDMSEMYDYIDDDYEERPMLAGCTCEHEPEEHTWGSCAVEECPCAGGWEE